MSDDGYLPVPEDDPAVELMLASRRGDLAYLRANVDSFGQPDTLGDSVLGHAVDEGTEASYNSLCLIAETEHFAMLVNRVNYAGFCPLVYCVRDKTPKFQNFLLARGVQILLPSEQPPGELSSIVYTYLMKAPRFVPILLKDLPVPGKYTPAQRHEAVNLVATDSDMRNADFTPYALAVTTRRRPGCSWRQALSEGLSLKTRPGLYLSTRLKLPD